MDDDAPTHVEDYAISATRRLSEKYAMNDFDNAPPNTAVEVNLDTMERIIRQRPMLPPAITMESILEDRRETHGDFTEDAEMAQRLKNIIRQGRNWTHLHTFEAEALDNMMTKVARILSGNPHYPDHWRDLQGFPRLVEERL
jgi:hypothetical protein